MGNPAWVNNVYAVAIVYGMKLVFAVAIIVVGRWVARILARVVERALAPSKLNPTLVNFLKNLVYFALLTFVFVAALNKLGVETTSFVALVGAAGLAIGLALQGSLANFAAGVMIVVFHPFEVGDMIREAGGAAGVVKEIQIFNTVLAGDKKMIIIPNAKITSDKIVVALK